MGGVRRAAGQIELIQPDPHLSSPLQSLINASSVAVATESITREMVPQRRRRPPGIDPAVVMAIRAGYEWLTVPTAWRETAACNLPGSGSGSKLALGYPRSQRGSPLGVRSLR